MFENLQHSITSSSLPHPALTGVCDGGNVATYTEDNGTATKQSGKNEPRTIP
jgi:hypothetical protein